MSAILRKQHIEAIAAVMRQIRRENMHGPLIDLIEDRLADVCATFVPGFDRSRFLRACRGEK